MISILDKFTPTAAFARLFAVITITVMFAWFALMNLDGTSKPIIDRWVDAHPFLSTLSVNIQSKLAFFLSAAQALIAITIALYAVPVRYKHYAYMAIVILSVAALSLMFTNPVWISSLGGFPAIGSGQGLIKYVAIAGVALWLVGNRHSETIMMIGLILVLGWIGAMKFTEPEANGVYPLLTSSPVFNWLVPATLNKLQASYAIGVIELVTVALLSGWWWNRKLALVGLWLAAVTFIITLSFMITFADAWVSGFPALSSAGQFLLKDLVLLAAAIALAAELRTPW